MSYPEIRLGDTIDIKFTSRAPTGQPTTLSSAGVVAYVNNGTTEIATGITLSVNFDGRTGLNNVRVVASAGNGFSAGSNVQLVLSSGTVAGIDVAGEVVGEFSIEKTKILEVTDRLVRPARCVTLGTVDAGAAHVDLTTVIQIKSLTPPAIDVNQFRGEILGFPVDTTTAGLRGEKTRVISNSTTEFVVEKLTTLPVEDDIFVIE